MTSKKVFEAMRSSDWQGVKGILSTKTSTPAEKHGVRKVFQYFVQEKGITPAELEEKHGVHKFFQYFVKQTNSNNSRRKFAILRPYNE